MNAWKIRFTHPTTGETRTVYSSVPTREEARTIAQVVAAIYLRRDPPGLNDTREYGFETRPWDPDHNDPDNDRAVSLETAILWALGRE